ncbi:MAG: CaiB/BaiF CoA transferase family protein [Candidatus Limnocylindria bacterium]
MPNDQSLHAASPDLRDAGPKGPLTGIRVVELSGIGPGPFCAMLLSDLGADVLRIERPEPVDLGLPTPREYDLLSRGRRSIAVDLKNVAGVAAVRELIRRADVLIEGFRPGVTERLGLGPDDCLAINPRLIYGRVTGWGQQGPLAGAAGHDISYIALTGVLHSIGPKHGPPVPPLNLVGDFAGGALYLALGLVAALLERVRSGTGQVVDAAMVDGAASLMTSVYGRRAAGAWTDARGENQLDGGAPWYAVYETADARYVCVGAIEERFYRELLRRLGLDREDLPDRHDRSSWPLLRERFAEVFRTRTRDEWSEVMEGSDACFAPVLSLTEAPAHPHNRMRDTFVEVDGVVQPAPAPRFSRTPGRIQRAPAPVGQPTGEALREWGFSAAEIAELRKSGALADH